MATRIIGKNARLYLDEFQLFLRLFDMSLDISTNSDESSVYADDWKTFEIIDSEESFDLAGRADSDAPSTEQDATVTLDQALFENMLVDPVVATFLPDGSAPVAGDRVLYQQLLQGSMTISTPRNGVSSVRLTGNNNGRVAKGWLLTLADVSLTAATDEFLPLLGTEVGLGFPNGIVAVHHVWKRTGAGNLVMAIQGSTTSGGAFTDRLTFATLATGAVGKEFKEQAETAFATEDFHRVRLQSSTTETVSVLVASRRY